MCVLCYVHFTTKFKAQLLKGGVGWGETWSTFGSADPLLLQEAERCRKEGS